MKKLLMITVVAVGASLLFADDAFIESSGSQAINTGYSFNGTTKMGDDDPYVESDGTRRNLVIAPTSISLYVNSSRTLTA